MNEGSLRKDRLAGFLVRWVVARPSGDEFVLGCGGLMTSSLPGSPPPPPPPPPAANAGITEGFAASAPRKAISVTILIVGLVMYPSARCEQASSCRDQPRIAHRIPGTALSLPGELQSELPASPLHGRVAFKIALR